MSQAIVKLTVPNTNQEWFITKRISEGLYHGIVRHENQERQFTESELKDAGGKVDFAWSRTNRQFDL